MSSAPSNSRPSRDGYDHKWLEDPSEELKCLICLSVAREPRQHGGKGCGKLFCESCISEHQKRSTNCPHCRENLTLLADVRSARHIRSLKVKCDNDVCEWTGELGDLETHLQSCDYALLPCTNECKIDNEIAKFLRKDLEEHLTNDCPRREYKCPHCQETGEHEERTTTHLETVLCPNDGCGVSNSHCQLPSHRSTCEYECVPCKYGCEERLLRKCRREHEEDTPLHLLALSKTREKRIKTESSNQPKTVTFRMTDFQKYKKNDDQWYSPPFYTSYTGYKMCLSVQLLGFILTLETSCVYGDNDRFTGTVTVELLNQLEDDNHRKNMSMLSVGLISSHLISDLDYNADKNTQYLKEDTLVFRVSVQVPDYKPWLEPTN